MRINMDCIRDILLCVEENTGLQQRCFFISYDLAKVQELIGLPAIEPAPYQIELEKLYANEDLIYHLKYCFDAGLIEAQDNIPNYQIWVADLTVKGHDLLPISGMISSGIRLKRSVQKRAYRVSAHCWK